MIIAYGAIFSMAAFLVLFWFFSKADTADKKKEDAALKANQAKHFSISSKDIETIAGDCVLTTQLDLARAYIETDRKNLAKNILSNVASQGNEEQQQEAERLLESLSQ